MMNINEVQKRIKQRPPFQMIDESKIWVLLKVDEFKFVKPVIPGDTLVIEVTKESGGAGLIKFDAKVTVDGNLRAKGRLAFCAVDKESIYA